VALTKSSIEAPVVDAEQLRIPVEIAQPAQEPDPARQTNENANAHPVERVEAFAPVTVEEPIEAKPVMTVTLEDIRKKVIALCAADKKAEVKAIVNEYAERVPDLPEDKWCEVYEKLTALEG
jgi:hypothetical protein